MQLSVPTETLNKQCLLLTFKRNIMYILSYKLPQFMAGGGDYIVKVCGSSVGGKFYIER